MKNKFNIFGKVVGREEACDIIANDLITSILGCYDPYQLYELLIGRWKSLDWWTDREIQDCLDDLEPENQWNWKE